jgi:hypothetical protein
MNGKEMLRTGHAAARLAADPGTPTSLLRDTWFV